MSAVRTSPGLDLADRLDLHELPARCAHLLADDRAERLDEVFTVDAVLDATAVGGAVREGLPAVIAALAAVDPPHPTAVVVDTADGRVELNSVAGAVRHVDRAVRTVAGWRIATRTVLPLGPGAPAARLQRLEDRAAIAELPVRYARAVDERDIDTWLSLFVPDVGLGPHGRGRAALRAHIVPQLRWFYRSVHLVCGHQIELLDAQRARGEVYCRAEHEVGDRWVVMAIRYSDDYRKIDGEWLFHRRRERHWYATDVGRAPQQVGFDDWGVAPAAPQLPHAAASWAEFWGGAVPDGITGTP